MIIGPDVVEAEFFCVAPQLARDRPGKLWKYHGTDAHGFLLC
jgi:hypothetical protein